MSLSKGKGKDPLLAFCLFSSLLVDELTLATTSFLLPAIDERRSIGSSLGSLRLLRRPSIAIPDAGSSPAPDQHRIRRRPASVMRNRKVEHSGLVLRRTRSGQQPGIHRNQMPCVRPTIPGQARRVPLWSESGNNRLPNLRGWHPQRGAIGSQRIRRRLRSGTGIGKLLP